ncbi:NADH dehydrogenase subunit M [Dyadobacter sp. SG02]|uniref:complex I subunit 4 family protein n=1 Tax=Dyadobacter sp. SG02 TaxID=1855291 RepID=UPI0008CE501B|nr:NADH-quinone oxidoreductase subunit M [Dyadobacter sp. SG02]SEJ59499.1 NADH dehydrogenase subunit M [Dyadobacter sp. SG02]
MMLVLLITVLMVGAVAAVVAGEWSRNAPRWIALIASSIGLLLVMVIWAKTSPHSVTDGQWLMDFRKAWIPSFGITFHLAIDGLSLLLLALTFFLGVLAVLCSWDEIRERTGFYYFNLLWILAGVAGVFMALDLFLFYFFWEVMLIPMYFLIGIWGSENRVYAAYKFFIFTQASGLLMFLAILGLYFIHGRDTGVYTFGYFELADTVIPFKTAFWLMSGFMIAFAVKLPVFPFHTWLPDAHGEAPTAGSLILAGLLLKTGAYGMLRFVVPLFPEVVTAVAVPAMVLGVAGIIYGAVMAYSQTDLKRLVAFTSVSHMGFVITGIFALNELALQGVVMQLVTHALSTGALFLMAGMIKERLHTRNIEQMGGLWGPMPQMGTIGLVFAMASLGLPGLGNFVAEFLILLGVFQAQAWITVAAATGLIFSAVYSLRIVGKIFLGPQKTREPVPDFSVREMLIMAALTVSVIWLGLFPQPVIDTAKPAITELVRFMDVHSTASHQQSYVK